MKHIMTGLLMALSCFAQAQEMWGISGSNYGGVSSVMLNPSSLVGAPYKYHLNLLTAETFVQNTYFYLPKESHGVPGSLSGEFNNANFQYELHDTGPQDGNFHSLLIGPSFFLNNGRSAWGIHTALRNEASASEIPYDLIKLVSEKFDYAPLLGKDFQTKPFSVAMLSWAEVGVTYGREVFRTDKHYISWAATLNGLIGFDGAYLDVRRMEYQVPDSATGLFHAVDATLAHAVPLSNFGPSSMLQQRGSGMSATAGVTYMHNRNEAAFACNREGGKKYDYRIGFSIVDMGAIRFRKEARFTELHTESDVTWNNIDTASFSSITSFSEMLSNEINGSVTTTEAPFTMWLPAAACLQADYCIIKNVYSGAAWLNRINLAGNQVKRNNQLNFSLRYERKQFETGVGLTFTEYRDPSAGFHLRYRVLVIGTDRLMEWLSMRDVRSIDFYFGLRLTACDLFKKKQSRCVAYGNLD